jgi:hypothetical protein
MPKKYNPKHYGMFDLEIVVGLPKNVDTDPIVDRIIDWAEAHNSFWISILSYMPLIGGAKASGGFKFYRAGYIELHKDTDPQEVFKFLKAIARKYHGFVAGQIVHENDEMMPLEVIYVKKE